MQLQYLVIPVGLGLAASLYACLRKQNKPVEGNTVETQANVKSTIKEEEPKPQAVKKQEPPKEVFKLKKNQELEQEYEGFYFGSFKLKASNSMHSITALDFKGSKLLIATTKNQMTLFNLKAWKKDNKNSTPEKFFVSLDNNGASAVCIGEKYFYAALTFDKTIVIYQFKGQNGIYFQQVTKFPRNIFKSNPGAMHVSKNQQYIITTGTEADCVVDVWSMKGEKLATDNSYLIYNYETSFGNRNVLIRGWTCQVKIFSSVEEKDGIFKKLQKKQQLAHEESPLAACIDNRDMYAISISKSHRVKIWNLFDMGYNRSVQSNESHADITSLKITKCSIYTFEPAVGHFKTLAVLVHERGFVVTDAHLKTVRKVQGVEIKDVVMNGTSKSVILGTVSPQGQISLWNLTKQLEKVSEVQL